MPDRKPLRTIEELRRVIRALGFEFKTDTVFHRRQSGDTRVDARCAGGRAPVA
jgi:hypothetical protein